MQYELKTQVIEPQRKTFTHLVERYGDRPASRYEEGSVDVQARENFHYRPTWAPDKELYDPAFSAYVLTDPDAYTDPRQYFYTPYVTNRSAMHEAFGKTLDYLENRDLLAKMPQPWHELTSQVFLPLRHLESGAQMVLSGAARFAYGSTVSQCCAYAGFDRVGNAQLISRVGITLAGGNDSLLKAAKESWMTDEALQGLRRYIEEVMIEEDWADGLVALDILDQLLYGLLYRNLDEAALLGGAGAYSLVAQHLSGWFTDNRRWIDALYKAWANDPEHGEQNVKNVQAVLDKRLPQATEAVTAVATKIDGLVDAGAVASIETLVADLNANLTKQGVLAAADSKES